MICSKVSQSNVLCDKIITKRERHDHLHTHFNDPNHYLICKKFKVNKHISQYRFKHHISRLCFYHIKDRFGHTKERFIEYAKKYNIEIKL